MLVALNGGESFLFRRQMSIQSGLIRLARVNTEQSGAAAALQIGPKK